MTLFPRPFTFVTAIGQFVKGVWEEVSTTSGTFIGSCQPMTSKEIESLPIEQRNNGMIKIYSNTQLKVARQGDNNPGSTIVFQNEIYEIVAEGIYQSQLINHYKYIAKLRVNT